MSKPFALGLGAVAVIAGLSAGAVVMTRPAGAQPTVTVYKTPD